MKRFIPTLTTLSLAILLSACNESEGSKTTVDAITPPTVPTTPAVNNEPINNGIFNYSSFDSVISTQNNMSRQVYRRIDSALGTGTLSQLISNVTSARVPLQPSSDQSAASDFYVGRGFFTKISSAQLADTLAQTTKILTADSFQVAYPNTNLIQSFKILSFDITDKNNYDLPVTDPATGKLITKTPIAGLKLSHDLSGLSFPMGSKCYAMQAKSNVANYHFSEKHIVNDASITSLPQWVTNVQATNTIFPPNGLGGSNLQASDIVYETIGVNNDMPAVHFKGQDGNYWAAVMYEGKIYQANYVDAINFDESPMIDSWLTPRDNNIDPKVGTGVQCVNYNGIAADYITQQLKTNINF